MPATLLTVTDTFGKKLTFQYGTSSVTVTDPNSEIYTYTKGISGELLSVGYPDSSQKSYKYDESAYMGGTNYAFALTGVYDENSVRYDSTWYGPGGVATQTALAGGVNQYTISNTLASDGRIQSLSLMDPLGAVRGRTFATSVARNKVISSSQPAATGTPAGSASYSFDANGNTNASTDLNGNVQCSVFDLTRNLETGRVEGVAPGSTCPTNIATYVPATGTVQRKILTQWHPIWHLRTKQSEPLKITTWTYNGDGGVYCAPTTAKVGVNPIGVMCTASEQATTDTTGGAGFSATAAGAARVWSYTYNNFGQVLTANGPRTDVTDVTTYTYYTCTTGAKCGQIDTISTALHQVTTFLSYDGNGKPLTISDPNGLVTTLGYDGRQRLTSSQIGTEITNFKIDPTGTLDLVTLPDGSTVHYTYDNAHRLNQITDGLGNYILYKLDAMGNRTAESAYDPSANLKRSHTRVFNVLSLLYQDITAANDQAVTTTYGYDANGNQTSVNAPLSRNTGNAFDALNRLKQVTDPNSGVTKIMSDASDNVASVLDPRNLTTGYTHDGFHDVTQWVSPDTGTSVNTFDTAGNLKTTMDARSAGGTYGYDALNRLTQIAYSDQTLNYSYDAGTNGVGRLTGASDAAHSMGWAYDSHGRVTAKSQVTAGITESVGYGYTNNDMTSLKTPSGQSVTYGYTNHRVTSISINGTTVLSKVTYDPFGPVNGWTWGDGFAETRTYNTDGNIASIYEGSTISLNYDNALRVSSNGDNNGTGYVWTLGYDLLDRVTSDSKTGTSYGWTYDANGNRLTQTGTNASTFTPSTTTNQLNSISGALARTYSYDAAGNTKTYGTTIFSYNQRGRLSSAMVGSTSASYAYNALSQLYQKTVAGTTTLLMYDEAGHLLGEYTGSGALIQETVWMDNTPVATIRPNGSAVTVFFVQTDNLDAPRSIVRTSDHSPMWRWDPDAFGTTAPNQNPYGFGTFIYNLRFPGQYFQAETGLNYNYFRDYDPQTGRYIESDPIGLAGGSYSTYTYTNNNPISNIDPKGLQTHALCLNPANVEACVEAGEISAAQADALRRAAKAAAAAAAAASCKSDEPDCVRASAFHLAGAGITDAEEFKRDYVGSAGGRFDICACKDGSIVIAAVGQCGQSGPKIPTGLTWKK